MSFPWQLVLRLVILVLKVLAQNPPDADHREAVREAATALEAVDGNAHEE